MRRYGKAPCQTEALGLALVQKTVSAHNTHRARKTPEVGRTGARFGPPGQWRLADDAEPDVPEEPSADSPIGLTGARFGGASRKRKRKPVKLAEPAAAPAPEPAAAHPPREEPEPDWSDADTPLEVDDHWVEEYGDWLARPESHALVRPYAWTGGRTRASGDLAIEALVHTIGHCGQAAWELRAISDLCRTPRSVAEVAALMSVPLGVARVLIADLADAGVLQVHQAARGAPDLVMMNRVLTGLRRL